MTFEELHFYPRLGLEGIQATTFFPNGYGASVVKGFGAYGVEQGLYELAVVQVVGGGFRICYDTSVADDVKGHLTPDAVTKLLEEIEALP